MAATVAMALGLGAVIAIFSVVDGVLLRPLPFPEPDGLVVVWNQFTKLGLPQLEISEPELLDYRKQGTALEGLAAIYETDANLTGFEEPERVSVALSTPDLFSVLKVAPAVGRGFVAADGAPDAPRTAVLNDGYWRRRFGADPGVVGRTLMLNGAPCTILGVMPPRFGFPSGVDLWVPLRLDPKDMNARGTHYLRTVGRLKPGVAIEKAQAEMAVIGRRLQGEYPGNYQADSGWGVNVVPLKDQLIGKIRPALLLLFGAVVLVLAIACVNVTNLLLARALARSREIAVRIAIGAGRAQVVRQFLVESLTVTLLGGLLGLLIAFWAVKGLTAINPDAIPQGAAIGLDARALLFAALLSLVSGLLIGLVPALQTSNPNLAEALREGGEKSVGSKVRRRTRSWLVAAEMALALVLMIGAGLLIKTFSKLQQVSPGFDPAGSLTMQLSLPERKYAEGVQVTAFFRQLLERLKALPGVRQVGLIDHLPMDGQERSGSYSVADRLPAPGAVPPEADLRSVSPGYFQAMAISLDRGRAFEDSDGPDTPPVVVVDAKLARLYWPGQDPIGKRVRLGGLDSRAPWMSVVGVVSSVRNTGFDVEPREQIYLPSSRDPVTGVFVVIRAAEGTDPAKLVGPVREQVRALDADLPLFDVRPMTDRLAVQLAPRRLSTTLLLALAALALVLSAVGMYGVVAYSVAQRTREIGVRMALGGQRNTILGMVIGQGLKVALVGVAIGILLSLAAVRFLESQLFGISRTDLATFLGVPLLLIFVVLAASYWPARRATRVDPLVALQRE
ncbi:MAG TPA: ABC transporter permease [Thermoanaerobaculia bacterium]|nr:ABC transporter permease [Thermoanaerobaculia bacterium]